MKRVFVWLSAVVLSVGLVACQAEEVEVLPTIAETAVEAGTFVNLVAALTATELVGTFLDAEAGPFTVFAPDDAAFVALISLVNDELGLVEGDVGFVADLNGLVAAVGLPYVKDVLLYHVVAGEFFAADVVQVTGFNTLLEDYTLEVAVEGGVVSLSGLVSADITTADIEASNGVIHVIDFVLLPYLPAVLTPVND
jgi:uncharacterized surface protein with fasciclin (FAS1) repeats